MKRIDTVSCEDWKKMGTRLEVSYDAILNLYTMLANTLGKSHPVTKKALTTYNKITRLKCDMQHLAKKNARDMFEDKEIDRLFPDVVSGGQNDYFNNWKGRY